LALPVARMAEKINACWCEEGGGKRSLGRHRRRWKIYIKTDLIRLGWEGVDWINLLRQTLAGSFEYGNQLSDTIKCG